MIQIEDFVKKRTRGEQIRELNRQLMENNWPPIALPDNLGDPPLSGTYRLFLKRRGLTDPDYAATFDFGRLVVLKVEEYKSLSWASVFSSQ